MNEQNNNVTPGMQVPNVTPPTPPVAPVDTVVPQAEPIVPQTELVANQTEPVVSQPVQNVEQPQVLPASDIVNMANVQPEVQQVPVQNNEQIVTTVPVVETPVVQAEPVQPVQQSTVNIQPQVPVTESVTQSVTANVTNQQVSPPVGNQIMQDNFGNPISTPAPQNNAINITDDVNSIAFVANDAPLKKKKNKGLIFGIVVGVLVALGLLGYFVIFPFVVRTYFSNPKNVYETTIKTLASSLTSTITDNVKTRGIYDIDLSLDTNIEELKSFSGYTYSGNFGVDPVKKSLQAGFTIKDKTTAGHSFHMYLKDNKEYVRYSTSRDLIYTGEADMESYNDLFKIIETTSTEDINYLINKVSTLLINSIDESKLSKEDASVTINGKTLKVLNHKYEINNETATKMLEIIVKGLSEDQKALEIIAKINDESVEDTKKNLLDSIKKDETNNENEESENDDLIIYTNIYTYGLKNDIVGFSLTDNKDSDEITYYKGKDYFELNIKISEFNEETNKDEINNTKVVGITQTGRTVVTIKENDKDVAKLTIKNWKENLYEFDYEIYEEDSTPKGTVKFVKDVNDSRLKYTLDFSLNMGKEDINISLAVSEDWTSEVANINTGTAVTLDDTQLEQKQSEFMTALMNTPVGVLMQTIAGFTSPDLMGAYSVNSNSMNDPYLEEDVVIE